MMTAKSLQIIGPGQTVVGLIDYLKNEYHSLQHYLRPIHIEIYYHQRPPDLNLAESSFLKIKSYPLSDYKPISSTTPIFYCSSVNESEIIKNSHGQLTRLMVAEKNLKLTDELLKKGIFDQGQIFVITNPCEIIAEYIATRSKNKSTYALGAYVDRLRYQSIFQQQNKIFDFELLGNHWFFPLPLCQHSHSKFNKESILLLHKELQEMVKKEFKDSKPPAFRGTQCLINALHFLFSLPTKTKSSSYIEVSGMHPDFQTYLIGKLFLEDSDRKNLIKYTFTTSPLQTIKNKKLNFIYETLTEIADYQKKIISQLF